MAYKSNQTKKKSNWKLKIHVNNHSNGGRSWETLRKDYEIQITWINYEINKDKFITPKLNWNFLT